ncbi:Serine/arginine repetitive matrix protein 1 [Yarrowia sp. B02]|nr:Serine/arginine repetitive matrix protein 1 [Yarrowia sp. B02]
MSFRGVPVSEAEARQRQERDLAKLRVPKIFREQVDMTKVNRPIINRWITKKLDELLPDDDIILDYTLELLSSDKPNIKEIQLNLNGFLEESTGKFCKELWELLVAAQEDKDGIPPQLIAMKKEEMEREKIKREIKIESWTGGDQRGGRGRGGRDRGGRERRDRDRGDRRDRDRGDRRDRHGRDRDRNRSRSPGVKRETDEYGRDLKD